MGSVERFTKEIAEKAERFTTDALPVVVKGLSVAMNGTAKALRSAEKGVSAVGSVVDKTSAGVNRVIDKTFGDAEERHHRSEQRYRKKRADSIHWLVHQFYSDRDSFRVLDAGGKMLYIIRRAYIKKYITYILYDSIGREIGRLTNDNKGKPYPIIQAKNPLKYNMEAEGAEPASILEYEGEEQAKYEIVPYGWTVSKTALRTEYTIMQKDNEIGHIVSKKTYEMPTYYLDHARTVDAKLMLLLGVFLIRE